MIDLLRGSLLPVLMGAMLTLLLKPPIYLAQCLCCLPADMRDNLTAQDLKKPVAMVATNHRLYGAQPHGHVDRGPDRHAPRG
jgi:hypothetical protein